MGNKVNKLRRRRPNENCSRHAALAQVTLPRRQAFGPAANHIRPQFEDGRSLDSRDYDTPHDYHTGSFELPRSPRPPTRLSLELSTDETQPKLYADAPLGSQSNNYELYAFPHARTSTLISTDETQPKVPLESQSNDHERYGFPHHINSLISIESQSNDHEIYESPHARNSTGNTEANASRGRPTSYSQLQIEQESDDTDTSRYRQRDELSCQTSGDAIYLRMPSARQTRVACLVFVIYHNLQDGSGLLKLTAGFMEDGNVEHKQDFMGRDIQYGEKVHQVCHILSDCHKSDVSVEISLFREGWQPCHSSNEGSMVQVLKYNELRDGIICTQCFHFETMSGCKPQVFAASFNIQQYGLSKKATEFYIWEPVSKFTVNSAVKAGTSNIEDDSIPTVKSYDSSNSVSSNFVSSNSGPERSDERKG